MCLECTPFFELIDPEERCPYCFMECDKRGMCQECKEKKRWILPVLSALEKRGPVSTLVHKPSERNTPFLAKTAASFMAVQFSKKGWQKPDYIIPIGRSFFSACLKGRSASFSLAKELSLFLDAPFKRAGRGIEDKVVLLVDDVLDREGRVFHFSEKLFAKYPKKIYVLTLCC